jgi:Flp pilus assembly protein TadG
MAVLRLPNSNPGRVIHDRSERGQSLVEMALALLFLVWLIAAIIDLGTGLFTWIQLRDAAQEGALYGSVNPADTPGIKTRVITASNRPVDRPEAYTDGTLTVDVGPVNHASACTGDHITVSLAYEYTPLIPLVNAIYPTITVHATVTDTVLLPEC